MRRFRGRVAVFVALMAVAPVACGGSNGGGGSSTANTVDENIRAGVQNALGGATTTSAAGATIATVKNPTSIAEWETLWATERAAIVKRIKDNKWGLQPDGKTVTGPEGFSMNLGKCASGWSNTEGLTDTDIKIGSHTPESGTYADSYNYNRGAEVLYKYYSEQGLFKDSLGKTRTLREVDKDDGYDAARAIPLVDEFLDSEKVFGIFGLGSAAVLKTYDKINQRCVPHLFNATGHPAWGDPVNHPWTVGGLFGYLTEAVLWGSFIDQHFEELKGSNGKVTVAALIHNNDFGKAYQAGFKAYLSSSANKDKIDFVSETIEAQSPTVKDPMTSLASKNPAIFVDMLAGTACAQSITEAAENGMKEKTKYMFLPSVCKPSSNVDRAHVGDASNGWWIMGGGYRDINSPSEDNNPFITWARDQLRKNGIDPKSSGNLGQGFLIGFGWAQSIAIAGQLDGGLTRSNLIVAVRSLDMTNPMLLDGIKYNLNGNKDAYILEGSDVSKYDAAQQSWIPQGNVIDLSGKSPLCAWDQSVSNCK
jgi:ABC-type branched-subunit amino acid transport system substrate-binding protein